MRRRFWAFMSLVMSGGGLILAMSGDSLALGAFVMSLVFRQKCAETE